MVNKSYSCPICITDLRIESNGMHCTKDHVFPFLKGTDIPVFDSEDENANEYTIEKASEIHENSLKWLFATFGSSEVELREKIISKLHLKKGQKILITGAGAGNDLPYFAKLLGKDGVIFAQDFASQMLLSAVERSKNIYGLADYNIEFSVSDATRLPFSNGMFDAVYHFGGLNIFPDIKKGISEMDRVVKSGGRVVFGDEGLAPWLKNTEYGEMVINNNPLCGFDAPLTLMPTTAREVKLSWEVGYCFYIIEYTASNEEIPIDMDVPHVGTRGGSIRTRYYGQLEGVNPSLKEALYDEAQKRGISRVEFLENLLRNGLKD